MESFLTIPILLIIMKTYAIASDHAGFKAKEHVKQYLQSKNYNVIDCGPSNESSVDYPDYAKPLTKKVLSNEADYGILICGTGNGMAITANKIKGIRAGLGYTPYAAKMTKMHNDANILVLFARKSDTESTPFEYFDEIVEAYITSEYEGGRHQKRIDKIE